RGGGGRPGAAGGGGVLGGDGPLTRGRGGGEGVVQAAGDAQLRGVIQHGQRLRGELRTVGAHRPFGRGGRARREPGRKDTRNDQRHSQNRGGGDRDEPEQHHGGDRQDRSNGDRHERADHHGTEIVDIAADPHQQVTAAQVGGRSTRCPR